MNNAQEMIAKAFGYKQVLEPSDAIFKIGKNNVGKILVVKDNKKPCAMCDKAHSVGYTSNESVEHLLKCMIPNTFNECYQLGFHNFICEHCAWSIVAYGSPSKMKYGQKIINVVVNSKGREYKHFNADDKNDLYGILKSPPKPPFIIMINSRGTVLENLVFTAKATISKKWIVVNYGLENLEVSPDGVFSCIHDARVIASKCKMEPTSDNIFNRQDDVRIKVNKKTLENENFAPLMGDFLNKYNRDCRLVSKMVIKAYLKEHKEAVITEDEAVVGGLFDF